MMDIADELDRIGKSAPTEVWDDVPPSDATPKSLWAEVRRLRAAVAAVGARLELGVGRLDPERASARGLTECHGNPQCARCRRMADMDALCALLPEGVHWGDPLTPELLRELLAGTAAKLLPPQIPNEFGHLLTPGALWKMYVE